MKEDNVKVYAENSSAMFWYLSKPNDISYYTKVIKKSELIGNVYIKL